jgi:hypothetical protein
MKRTNELIRIAEGYEPADSPFMKEGTDTGYPIKPEDLCEECNAFGFCKRGNPERFEAYKQTALIKTNTL